jgi:hypothetical protein
MYLNIIYLSLVTLLFTRFGHHDNKSRMTCTDPSCQLATNHTLACTLTTAEMRQRKSTVIANLQKEMIEKKELKDGYSFRFKGTDEMVDELSSFIKTERECCSFFTFTLSVAGDKSSACLELTGPKGAKDFIKNELGL